MPNLPNLIFQRCISYCEKEIGIWMGDHDFKGIELDLLKTLVDAPETDSEVQLPYLLNESQAEILKGLIDIEFKFRFYDYFLHGYF